MFKFKKAVAFATASLLTLSISTSVFAAPYTVKSGDSLYSIGMQFNMTANTIMQNSGLQSTTIYPGQVLNIPSWSYTVKSGDSLYLIAKRYYVSVISLRILNSKWDDMLYVGQRLNIPGRAPSGTTVTTSNTNGVISYTSSELNLLARLIEAEAANQSYRAKVAVGAVVVNRVQDPSNFANTITGVIYEKLAGFYQFTPVENGYINNTPSAESIAAAKEALRGTDPTNGALFYFDDSATNKWLWSKPIALYDGDMVYVY